MHSIKKSTLDNFDPYAFKNGFNNEQGYDPNHISDQLAESCEGPSHIVALHEIRSRHDTNSIAADENFKIVQ